MNSPPNMLEHVMARFAARAVPQRIVAEKSGVPFSTVNKVSQGYSRNPRFQTVQRLYEFFVAFDAINVRAASEPVQESTGQNESDSGR